MVYYTILYKITYGEHPWKGAGEARHVRPLSKDIQSVINK